MKTRKTLTKKAIENMVKEIIKYMEDNQFGDCYHIYANGKRFSKKENEDILIEENISPFDYFEWACRNHILSVSFENDFYDVINFYYPYNYCDRKINEFDNILEKYGVYYELGNSWNLSVTPIDDDMKVQYTHY